MFYFFGTELYTYFKNTKIADFTEKRVFFALFLTINEFYLFIHEAKY